jgi:ATP synthase protein I
MGSIKEELASQFRSLSVALTISMSVVFSVFAGAISGYYLDTWLFDGRTYPWLTIICLFFGIAGAAKNFLILTKRFTKEPGEKKGKDQPEVHTSGRQDDV